ncbi:MAG: lysophospholipid acyltransferase family protein [Clostridia bacterium]
MLYYFLRYTLAYVLYIFIHPEVHGAENLNVKGKAIFIANHLSMADPIILALVSPRIIHFMAKAELFENWFLKFILRAFLVFPVKRKTVDMQSIKIALSLLNEGKVFGIFPEGKRSTTGDLDEFEKGAAFLAVRSGAPIIPICLKYRGRTKFHPIISVGKPFSIEDIVKNTKKSSAIDLLNDEMTDAVNALKTHIKSE